MQKKKDGRQTCKHVICRLC